MLEALDKSEKRKPIMNVREIAGYLRISEAKVYRLVKQDGIPIMRIGEVWRFRKDNGCVKTLKQAWKVLAKMLEPSFNWILFLELS